MHGHHDPTCNDGVGEKEEEEQAGLQVTLTPLTLGIFGALGRHGLDWFMSVGPILGVKYLADGNTAAIRREVSSGRAYRGFHGLRERLCKREAGK